MSDRAAPVEYVVDIRPQRGWALPKFQELWDSRDLLAILLWRDVAVRYKQTLLGVGWAIIQPLATTIIFTIVFGRLARMPSDGVPYALFSFTGLLVWNFVATGVSRSAQSLVSSGNLITKVYFPRLLVPIAASLSGAADFAVSLAVLAGMMAFYGVAPTIALLALPLCFALAVILTLGVGLWLGALNARYRDVAQITPFLIQIWLYASPVAYSNRLVPGRWQLLYALNPVSGLATGVRWALLGTPKPAAELIIPGAVVAVSIFVSGLVYFRRKERTVADVL